MPRLQEWFIPREGIAREVITADIQRYLGEEARVRPALGTEEHKGEPGFCVTAYRNLTANMIQDLKADTLRWRNEQNRNEMRHSTTPDVKDSVSSADNGISPVETHRSSIPIERQRGWPDGGMHYNGPADALSASSGPYLSSVTEQSEVVTTWVPIPKADIVLDIVSKSGSQWTSRKFPMNETKQIGGEHSMLSDEPTNPPYRLGKSVYPKHHPADARDDSESLIRSSTVSKSSKVQSTQPSSIVSHEITADPSAVTMYDYSNSKPDKPTIDRDNGDLESIRSLSDDDLSQTGTLPGVATYQEAAAQYIVKVLLEDQELSSMYEYAICKTERSVPQEP
jgi:hypothetical protein